MHVDAVALHSLLFIVLLEARKRCYGTVIHYSMIFEHMTCVHCNDCIRPYAGLRLIRLCPASNGSRVPRSSAIAAAPETAERGAGAKIRCTGLAQWWRCCWRLLLLPCPPLMQPSRLALLGVKTSTLTSAGPIAMGCTPNRPSRRERHHAAQWQLLLTPVRSALTVRCIAMIVCKSCAMYVLLIGRGRRPHRLRVPRGHSSSTQPGETYPPPFTASPQLCFR
jgi:hypothetical protein